jgi:hypothetical protein
MVMRINPGTVADQDEDGDHTVVVGCNREGNINMSGVTGNRSLSI